MACSEAQIKSGALVIPQSAFGINQTPSDTGQRPLEPCNAYWENPNVWFERDNPPKLSGDPPSTQFGTAVAGSPTYVAVQVFNNSQNTLNNVKIQVWVCDFTMGVSPSSSRASAGGAQNPMTNPDGVNIGAGKALVVRSNFLWTPNASDAATNGGHLCLAANVYADGPPTADGSNFLTSLPIFLFCCDSHHAQRNINVVAMSFRQQVFVAHGDVFVASPIGKAVDVEVEMVEFHGDVALREPVLAQLQHEHPNLKLQPSKLPVRKFGFSGNYLPYCQKGQLHIPAKGHEALKIEVEIDPKDPVGSFHLFHATQTDRNGDVIGGVTFVTVVVP